MMPVTGSAGVDNSFQTATFLVFRIVGDEISECAPDIDTEHVAHASHLGA